MKRRRPGRPKVPPSWRPDRTVWTPEKVQETLDELEDRGYILIVPAAETDHGQRAIVLLRRFDSGPTLDPYDLAAIEAMEQECGIRRGSLARRCAAVRERGWSP